MGSDPFGRPTWAMELTLVSYLVVFEETLVVSPTKGSDPIGARKGQEGLTPLGWDRANGVRPHWLDGV